MGITGRKTPRAWVRVGGLITIALVLVIGPDVASAAASNSPFDGLVTELEARSAALADSGKKADLKLKKRVDKVLKVLDKAAGDVDRELKAAAKAAKRLAKLFPGEMAPGNGDDGTDGDALYDLMRSALEQCADDIGALTDAAQHVVDGAPHGKCRDKAQAVIDDADVALASWPGLPDVAAGAKRLGQAHKRAAKGQVLAAKALGCVAEAGSPPEPATDGEPPGEPTACEPESPAFIEIELPLLTGDLPYPPPSDGGPAWITDSVWPDDANPSDFEDPVGEVISIPNGRPVYALIVSGYETNRYLDDLLAYDFATHLMAQGAYVHWAWWNNLLAPYMERPLHHSDSYPGDLENDVLKFNGLTAPSGGVQRKAYPAEDFQFVADAKLMLEAIREHNPSAIIVVVGHSMGGSAVTHLASETDVLIDLLAPIDPVNNRNYPWSGSAALNTLDEQFFNWTRWRVTRDGFLGFKGNVVPLGGLACEVQGDFWNPSLDEVDTGLTCDWVYHQAPALTFDSNIINLYHRWQTEAKFPFDYEDAYDFGHELATPDVISTQAEVVGIKSDPGPLSSEPDPGGWPYGDFNPAYADEQCCPTEEGIAWSGDGHGEIVGFRGPINSDIVSLFSPRAPVPLGVRVGTSDNCGNCGLETWPTRTKAAGEDDKLDWGDPGGATRADLLRQLEADAAALQDTWEHRPFNPALCLVSGDAGDVWDGTGGGDSLIGVFEAMNRPPLAVAGEDQELECTGPEGTDVVLDGSGTSDPNDDIESYEWTWDGGSATGETVTAAFPLGETCVTLTVRDSVGHESVDVMTVTIEDTTPPELTVSLSPTLLWPPNHKLKDIEATVEAEDLCGEIAELTLVSITSSDPDNGIGDGNTTGDIAGHEPGTLDTAFQLRAEWSGPSKPRIYTVTYQATDASGNRTEVSREVIVDNPAP